MIAALYVLEALGYLTAAAAVVWFFYLTGEGR